MLNFSLRRITVLCCGWLLVAATGAFSTPFGDAATALLSPLKDNTLVESTNPASQLSGGQGDIFVGRTNQASSSIRRGLIAFDLNSLPAGITITGATLTMRDIQGLNGDQTVSLHLLSQDWGEGASTAISAAVNGDATWLYTFFNSASPGASPTWSVAGGSYAPGASAASVVSTSMGAGQLFSWSSAANPQMLLDVQQWYANPSNNFGWILIGNESVGQTAKRFNGGEATTPPAMAPILTVEYVIPEPGAAALAAAAMLVAARRPRRREPPRQS